MTWDVFDPPNGRSMTYSHGNLWAIPGDPGAGLSWAVTTSGHSTGKYYFEVEQFYQFIVGYEFSVGVTLFADKNGAWDGGPGSAALVAAGLQHTVKIGGSAVWGPGGDRAYWVCVAVDLDHGLIWFKSQVADDWNDNPAADPATGVGGHSLGAIAGQKVYAVVASHSGSADIVGWVAHFGDTGFSGTVPTGFTPGWPAVVAQPAFAVAELWFGATNSFVDLSVAANRQKFHSSAGGTQYLGANGELPTGAAPAVYLSDTSPSNPATFATNAGTGGAFTVNAGTLEPYGNLPPVGPSSSTVVSAGTGADPQMMLDWSDDGARTWRPLTLWRSMGRQGEYQTRLRWTQLGCFRQRVLRLTCTDPVRRNIIGAYVDVEPEDG